MCVVFAVKQLSVMAIQQNQSNLVDVVTNVILQLSREESVSF